MYRIYNASRSPYFNLALEEYLLRHSSDDFFILWRNDPAVICGRGQNIYEEADICAAADDGIAVCRRFSGGGTVFHDEGNINYTFIRNYDGELDFTSMISPVVSALNRLGVKAELSGVSDITAGGRKISGNAQARLGNRLLHHGTLLFNTDLSRLNRVAGEKRAFYGAIASKSVKSRVASVANINEFLPCSMTVSEFESAMGELICPGIKTAELDDETVHGAEALAREKYSAWEWIYGYSPRFQFDSRGIAYTAYHGKIESVEHGLPEELVGARLDFGELTGVGLSEETARFVLTGKREDHNG